MWCKMTSKIALIIAAVLTVLMALIAVFSGSVGVAAIVVLLLLLFVLGIFMNRIAAKKVEVLANAVENSNLSGGIALDITVRNNSRIPVFQGVIKVYARNMNFDFAVQAKETFSVPGKSERVVRMHIRSEYCGKYRILLKDVRCIDLWGVTGVSVCRERELYACMFPKRYSVGKVTEAIKQNYEKEKKFAGRRSYTLSDILQYREYQKGDSLKNVNWKLSVKHDQLLVREFDTPIDNQLLILVDINQGDPEYQNMIYHVCFSICSTYLEQHFSYQIGWQDGDQLVYGHVETMEDLLAEFRKLLSASIENRVPAASVFESQDRKEKYARILYVTNSLNRAMEHRLQIWGNVELLQVDERFFPNEDLRSEMKRLAV